ncbi:MAG: hypothetical protein NTV52_01140, partial [Acidobacteria bacterium]|nr:hypothetical protein [Acidobacteriota bacterium]
AVEIATLRGRRMCDVHARVENIPSVRQSSHVIPTDFLRHHPQHRLRTQTNWSKIYEVGIDSL